MRILIVGSDINAYSLAKKFSEDNGENIIFVAPGNKYISEFATSIDIAESDVQELLDFALANEINLTLSTGTTAIQKSLADVFKANNLSVFAPTSDAARFILTSSIAKKFLYKNKVTTPKFAVFDKENMAIDYVRKSKYPLVIKNDYNVANVQEKYCYTFSQAKFAILDFFEVPDAKIVVEDFLPYKKITQYFLTDGYTAFPIGGVEEFNISEQKLISQGVDRVCCLTSKVSRKILSKLMTTVIHPLLDEISAHSGGYVGVIGVELYVAQDEFQVIDFDCGLKKLHMQVILPLLGNDFYNYLYAATIGSLADDYNEIKFGHQVTAAIPLKDAELSDDIVFAKDAENSVFSVQASNLSNAIVQAVDILEESGVSAASYLQKTFEEAVFYA